MQAGGQAGAVAGTAGHAGESAGASSGGDAASAGSGGSAAAGGGAAGVAMGGVAGGNAGSGAGAAGASTGDGPPLCNELELLEVGSVCSTTVSGLEPQGGTLVDGLYALVEYELTACSFHLEQTLRLQQTAENTYHMDTVVNVDNFHSSGTFVMDGVMLSSTLDCGAEEVNRPYGFTVLEDNGEQYFLLFRGGIYTYHRVGD